MKITGFNPEFAWMLTSGASFAQAGGDLTGTYPGPLVTGIWGVAISSNHTPTTGDVLTAFSPTLLGWATPSNALGSNAVTRTLGGQETVVTYATTGTARALDLGGGNVFDVTLTGSPVTLTFYDVPAGVTAAITLLMRQDATGSRLVTWPGSVVWPGGTTPTLSTAANAVDVFALFTINGGTTWFGFPTGSGGGTTSPLTTLGDLYTYSTTNARLAVGSNGTGLLADSTQTTGNRWSIAAIHGEVLMQDGVTAPPVPLETDPARNDWLFGDM